MTVTVLTGDCLDVLKTLPDESVHCCVTSPPYWGLRDYGHAGQIGLEDSPDEFVARLVDVFREVRRALRDDGTVWLNLGDSYGGRAGSDKALSGKQGSNRGSLAMIGRTFLPPDLAAKQLIGIPWRVAFALQADGWWLRSDIIWSKKNPMPESVTDRPTKAHEYIFLLAKSERYYYDAEAIAEKSVTEGHRQRKRQNGLSTEDEKRGDHGYTSCGIGDTRNRRSVWEIATQPYRNAHFATFPPDLIEPCIKAGCPVGGTVLDPFGGAGTTGLVADRLQRNAILIELNPAYAQMARNRIKSDSPLIAEVT